MVSGEESVSEAIRRTSMRGEGNWTAFVFRDDPTPDDIEEVSIEIEGLNGTAPRLVNLSSVTSTLGPADDWVLLTGFHSLTADDWISLDRNRDAWRRMGSLWFLLDHHSASLLCEFAHNIRSLLGSLIFVAPSTSIMSDAERLQRLQSLQHRYSKLTEQVIAEAESKTLELSPHMVEWLVLAGRGDLV